VSIPTGDMIGFGSNRSGQACGKCRPPTEESREEQETVKEQKDRKRSRLVPMSDSEGQDPTSASGVE
jgi:hypothetical protein